MEDSKKRIIYCCQFCQKQSRVLITIKEHVKACKEQIKLKKNNIDYVICDICNFHGQNLGIHLKKIHGIESKDYNGLILSEKAYDNYKRNAKKNGDWINRAKANGDDLLGFKRKISISTKKALKNNEKEKLRRSKLMKNLHENGLMTDDHRAKLSEASKKTAARPEIIKQRTERLEQWRKNYPEEFYNKCTRKMHETWNSKPELILFEIVSKIDNFNFKRNQFVKSNKFISKSKRKQIDMADKDKRVYIEFDGIHHFKDVFNDLEKFNFKQQSDLLLDQHIEFHNWILIRISWDQFSYKDGFKNECIQQVKEILKELKSGVYKIGKLYEQY